MRARMRLVENFVFGDGEPEPAREFGQFKFIHVPRRDGSLGRIEIKHGPDNMQIGLFSFVSNKTGENSISGHLSVRPGFRGQGLGINLYRIIMKMTEERGLRLVPSATITDGAHSIWSKIDPKALEGYQRSSKPYDDHHGHLWSKNLNHIPPMVREDVEHID